MGRTNKLFIGLALLSMVGCSDITADHAKIKCANNIATMDGEEWYLAVCKKLNRKKNCRVTTAEAQDAGQAIYCKCVKDKGYDCT